MSRMTTKTVTTGLEASSSTVSTVATFATSNSTQSAVEEIEARIRTIDRLLGVLEEDQQHASRLPLYIKPGDFIDELGRPLSKTNNNNNNSNSEASIVLDRIKGHLSKRYRERHDLLRQVVKKQRELEVKWSNRLRKREAEWGEPEDLGVPVASTHGSEGAFRRNDEDLMEDEMAALAPYKAVTGNIDRMHWMASVASIPAQITSLPRTIQVPGQFHSITHNNGNSYNKTTALLPPPLRQRIPWSPAEKKTFIQYYLQHPKNFGLIAAHLPFRSVCDCVQFYYQNKGELKLKQMVVAYRRALVAQKKMSSGMGSGTSTSSSPMLASNTLSTNSNNQQQQQQSSAGSSGSATRTGRPVGRPKNKDRDRSRLQDDRS